MSDADLPAADVLIVGASLAGLRLAARLARDGARVVLLDAAADPGAPGPGDPGLAPLGLVEHPHRLVASVGTDTARALLQFTATGLAALADAGALAPTGTLCVALAPGEEPDIDADLATLDTLGFPATALPAADAAAATSTTGLGRAWSLAAGGWADAATLHATLLRAALDAGATIRGATTVHATATGSTTVRADTSAGPVHADALVLACGWPAAAFDPFLGDKLWPVRAQALPLTGPAPDRAFTTQHGWIALRPTATGAILTGCRWATPHLEAGETTPEPSPAVDERLRAFAARYLPGLQPTAGAWATIQTHTCDNLPLVGPLPGRARTLVCTGWNGRPLPFALAAADALADGLLTGRAPGLPACLSPTRFL
jgi:glycine/D-amino acid oxidase-like deaminating enzyme